MRHPTVLTHCALTCCVMWGIVFGFIASSITVLLRVPKTDSYVTPEMYAGVNSSGFHEAVREAIRQRKPLRATRTYDDVRTWTVDSNLDAFVNRIPNAKVEVSNVKNVSLVVQLSESLHVSDTHDSTLRLRISNTGRVSSRLMHTNLSISGGTVRLSDMDVRQTRLRITDGNATFVGALLSIESRLAANSIHMRTNDHETALVDTIIDVTDEANCERLVASSAFRKSSSCEE